MKKIWPGKEAIFDFSYGRMRGKQAVLLAV